MTDYLVKVDRQFHSFTVRCSTFQCYLLLECNTQQLAQNIMHLVTSRTLPVEYLDIINTILDSTNTPLKLKFHNVNQNGDTFTVQEVRRYYPWTEDQHLSFHTAFNNSVSQYSGQDCFYGGILIIELSKNRKQESISVIQSSLCGSQVIFLHQYLNLTLSNVYLVFYSYKEFGMVNAEIEISISPCIGIFLNPVKCVTCNWPVQCYDQRANTKCHPEHFIYIHYPNETCIHIQYISDICHFAVHHYVFIIISSSYSINEKGKVRDIRGVIEKFPHSC